MEIVLILILLFFLILFLFLLFRFGKWILGSKTRIKWAVFLVALFALSMLIDIVFFTKMEFIQSKVYPDLYLIKNPLDNKDELQNDIKKMVLEKFNSQVVNQISKYKRIIPNDSIVVLQYTIDFYEYNKGSIFIPFNDAGTYYFIENKEDPGGFSVEVLDMYPQYHMAQFNLKFCKNDTVNYFGTIDYYKNWDIIKTDTIINLCTK